MAQDDSSKKRNAEDLGFGVVLSLYNLLTVLSVPFILLKLWWRGFKNPAYRDRWLERFGVFKAPVQSGGIWIHAVSVGESVAAVPLVRQLQKRFPQTPIIMTTTTPTGSDRVQSIFGNEIFHVYFPYDLTWSIQQFLARIRPRLLILMETELWPNCLSITKQQGIPIVIANACLSESSWRGYRRIPVFSRAMLECVSLVAAQSALDGERFIELGLSAHSLVITGNMKFDVIVKKGIAEVAALLRAEWGIARPVLIAASTHAGEEEPILEAFKSVLAEFRDALLIIVPRHPERFASVGAIIQKWGYSITLRSAQVAVEPNTQVLLVDTMGELDLFYAASDIACVGGSLVPIGGHNILEAAARGIPVIVGPYIDNIVDTVALLSAGGAVTKIKNNRDLVKAVLHWFSNPELRKRAGMIAQEMVEKNRGAVEKIVDLVERRFM